METKLQYRYDIEYVDDPEKFCLVSDVEFKKNYLLVTDIEGDEFMIPYEKINCVKKIRKLLD